MITRATLAVVLALGLVLPALVAEGQQPTKVNRIGYLGPGAASVLPEALEAFRQTLRQIGYVEGQNLAIDYRWAGEKDDRLLSLATELARLKVDVIVVEGHTPAIQAAKKATVTIPIVMAVSGDPVRTGLVTSLAQPGGNVTGLSIQTPELAPKRLEILKEVLPKLGRVAILWNAANPVKVLDWQETEAAAKALGFKLQSLDVRGPADLPRVFDMATKDRADALVVFGDGLINANRRQILEFAGTARLPAMHPYKEFVEAGGLLSYAPSYPDLFRRAAVYVDRILKGAKPADLPVERATKYELVINMKTAKALGLTIPPSLLLRADQIIE